MVSLARGGQEGADLAQVTTDGALSGRPVLSGVSRMETVRRINVLTC